MLLNYHIGRLVLSSLCVGEFGAAGVEWCSFCSLKHSMQYIFPYLNVIEIKRG